VYPRGNRLPLSGVWCWCRRIYEASNTKNCVRSWIHKGRNFPLSLIITFCIPPNSSSNFWSFSLLQISYPVGVIYQSSMLTMASSSPNQPPSEHTANAKPEQPKSDPATTSHFQWTVKGSNELTDPSTEEILRKAASDEYVSNGVLIQHS
jgi:hypothetical protein